MNYNERIDAGDAAAPFPPHDEAAPGDGLDAGAEPLASGRLIGRRLAEVLRTRRRAIAGGVAVLIALGLWGALERPQPPAFSDQSANQAPVVTVITPGRTLVTGTINATGVLAARHDMPVGVVGDGGAVARVLVDAGQWVRAGQLLAIVDRSVQRQQLLNQQANIAVTQADARLAQSNLDRALKLVDRGFISMADIDRLTATRDAAKARVKVAVAQRDEMAARVRRLDIVAPADGLVLERDVEPGQVVSPSSGTLFRIAERGEMELKAKLSESDLAGLALGQAAMVTPVGTSKGFAGKIWQLSPVIDPQSRQGMARIALDYAPDIRPGGFATAQITSGSVVAPLLPESALQADAGGSFVYVIGKGNRAERRAVTIGLINDSGLAITAGLSGSERVVLRAGAFLSEGETVNPRPVSASPGNGR